MFCDGSTVWGSRLNTTMGGRYFCGGHITPACAGKDRTTCSRVEDFARVYEIGDWRWVQSATSTFLSLVVHIDYLVAVPFHPCVISMTSDISRQQVSDSSIWSLAPSDIHQECRTTEALEGNWLPLELFNPGSRSSLWIIHSETSPGSRANSQFRFVKSQNAATNCGRHGSIGVPPDWAPIRANYIHYFRYDLLKTNPGCYSMTNSPWFRCCRSVFGREVAHLIVPVFLRTGSLVSMFTHTFPAAAFCWQSFFMHHLRRILMASSGFERANDTLYFRDFSMSSFDTTGFCLKSDSKWSFVSPNTDEIS
jgi:hypothetical protein